MPNPTPHFSPVTHFATIERLAGVDIDKLAEQIFCDLYEGNRTAALSAAINDFITQNKRKGEKVTKDQLAQFFATDRSTLHRWRKGQQIPSPSKLDDIFCRMGKATPSFRPKLERLRREIFSTLVGTGFQPRLVDSEIATAIQISTECHLPESAAVSVAAYQDWRAENLEAARRMCPDQPEAALIRLLDAAACWQYGLSYLNYPLLSGVMMMDERANRIAKEDIIIEGPDAVLAELFRLAPIERKGLPLRPDDIDAAAETFLIGVGDNVHASGERPTADAMREGLATMKLSSVNEVREIIQRWKNYCEHSVWFKRRRGEPHLISVVVPLTEENYYKFRNGDIDDREVASGTCTGRSEYLLVLGVFGDFRSSAPALVQLQLMGMMISQIALLGTRILTTRLTLVSIVGSETSEKRLRKWGFKRIEGKRMARSGLPIVELQLSMHLSEKPKAVIVCALIWIFQSMAFIRRLSRPRSK